MPRLDDLLQKTSRTFGISIPLLPEPTRREATVAYLLFRIADTLEDGDLWPPERRAQALERLAGLLRAPSAAGARAAAAQWTAAPPCEHAGYRELLAGTPFVLAELGALAPPARACVERHALRTVEGMAGFVARAAGPGGLRLRGMEELRRYCYVVAGIVGEMLTDLFALVSPGLGASGGVVARQGRLFGEGLQLVNILKDAAADRREGRWYFAGEAEAAGLLALAREDLEAGVRYLLALREGGAAPGVLAFVALPLLLARATLERVEAEGPGSRVSRGEVAALLDRVRTTLAPGAPAPSAETLLALCARPEAAPLATEPVPGSPAALGPGRLLTPPSFRTGG